MERWNQIEAESLLWIQENIRTELLDQWMIFFSAINNSGIVAITAVIALLLWRRYRHVGITAGSSLFVEFILVNVLLKNMVQRMRPYVVNGALVLLGDRPGDFSFPSGHTGSAFAVAIVLYLSMPKRYGIPALALATLVALSRIYNGAHYPTDVLGSIVIAFITGVVACKFVFPLALKRLL